ncbi:maleylpyruvate isomerase family mycothiol-dependent enzyme [Kocuria sp. CPCC 205263]|uniref:maleylpyruvate isomerase family mycothiol-dependent enzyme n=1 Tax=Kocuria sp. CPCC 205263 TaxID=3073555 RepID=UPI0034D58194
MTGSPTAAGGPARSISPAVVAERLAELEAQPHRLGRPGAGARIMETFAHGQDIRDALGIPPVASPRLRHIAHLGVANRDYAFRQRRLDPPAEPFRVELTHEDEAWTWGPADATQRVHGPALDFALLATRRRRRRDGSLVAEGPDADAWLDIVQAFAGRPGPGRAPLL